VKNIFVSSTSKDLKEERNQAIITIDTLDSAKAIAMERFSSDPNPPKDVCLSYLQKCDAVVLILGYKYGSKDNEENISFTEIEYNEAKRRKLPVFVFIKNNPKGKWENKEEEIELKKKLDNFKARLEPERKRETFKTGDELGRKIATAIHNYESKNGEIGIKYKPFQEGDEYFKPFLNKNKLFNLCHPFFGRTGIFNEICEFIESDIPILIIHGRGGIGKTKLLLEIYNKISNVKDVLIWFLQENGQLSSNSFGQIPLKQKNVIIIDDSHRHNDLNILLKLAIDYPESIRLIFALRNYGLNYLKSQCFQVGFNPTDLKITPELTDLSRQEMENLADSILDSNHKNFRDSLVHIARDSPLVLVVGAKLINDNSINPSLLVGNIDFQSIVLNKFSDSQMEYVSDKFSKRDVQKILTIISALQPVNLYDSTLLNMIAKSANTECHELNLIITELETAGILVKKGQSSVRITPDVFSDYLLSEACVTQGRPTGYAEKVFDEFYEISPREIMSNLSELDWRFQSNESKVDLMSQIWARIFDGFKKGSNLKRYLLLLNIEKIAYFQPEKSLEIVQFALRNPSTENEQFLDFPEYTHENIKSIIPKILQKIAYNIHYLSTCCDILWDLGKDKEGILTSDTTHPLRILQDIAEYGLHKPLDYQSEILNAAEEWFEDPKVHDYIHSPLDIIDPILKKDGEDSRFTGRTVQIAPFAISYNNTQKIRKRALSIVFFSANQKSIRGKIRALKSLMSALYPPYPKFGRNIPDSEYSQWVHEENEILDFIVNYAKKTRDPIIRIIIRQNLIQYLRSQKDEGTRKRITETLKGVRDTYEMRLVRALLYSFEHKRPQDFLKENKIIEEKIKTTAIEFTSKNVSHHDAYSTLNRYLHRFYLEKIGANPGRFFYFIGKHDPDYAHELCLIILSENDSLLGNYFCAFLSGIKEVDQSIAKNLILKGLKTDNSTIKRSIGFGYSCGWWNVGVNKDDLPIIIPLLDSDDKELKRLAIESLAEFPNSENRKIKDIALNIDIDSNFSFADALCKLFSPTSIKPALKLTKSEILKFMMKFITIPNITRQAGAIGIYVDNFFNYAGEKNPDAVLSLFFERIKYIDKIDTNGIWDRYEPIPYLPTFDYFKYFKKHPNYQKLLKKVRDNALIAKRRSYYGGLFLLVSNNYSTESLKILEDWVDSKDEDKIRTVCTLIQKAPPEFLLTNSTFICQILESSKKFNDDCFKEVQATLYDIARFGGRTGTMGEPFPLDVKIKTESEKLAIQYSHSPVTRKFYTILAEKANGWMENTIIDDEDIIGD